jgi:hypothetical protein
VINLDDKLISEAEWIFERMRDLGVKGGESYAYYQGLSLAFAGKTEQFKS